MFLCHKAGFDKRFVRFDNLQRPTVLIYYPLAFRVSGRPQFKILNPVVRFVTVYMVYGLVSQQTPADMFLNNQPMFAPPSSPNRFYNDISIVVYSTVSDVPFKPFCPRIFPYRSVHWSTVFLTPIVHLTQPFRVRFVLTTFMGAYRRLRIKFLNGFV